MSEWKTYKLGEICKNVCSGGTPKSTEPLYYGGDIPWLNTKEVDFCRIDKTEKTITDLGFQNSSAKWVEKNSVIVAMYGATAAKVAINTIPLTTNQACCNLTVNADFADFRFVYFYLCYKYASLAALANGGAQQNLNAQRIKDFEITVPSLNEQKRIADVLWALDDKIELNRRINANLEEQAQALFKSWFVDFEPFKDGPFVDSELGKIPATFKIDYIGNVPHKIESGKRPKGGALEYGVPSIGAENIKGLGVYDYTKTKYIPEDFALAMKKGKINGYELLIYKDGGKPGYFIPNFTIFGDGFPYETMYINEHVFCLDFFDKGFNLFSYFYMQTPYIKNRLNTIGGKAAIPGINVKDIESLPIFSNENEKVKEFGILFLPAIKTILHNCVENKKLSTLRDTLLPKLMKGEIRIK